MRLFFSLFFFAISLGLNAQLQFGFQAGMESKFFLAKDSTKADTLPRAKMPAPKKAAILSACLPGLGQLYNHKWWKVPIIYAGFGGLTYGFIWNHNEVKGYRDALRLRYDDDPTTIDQFPRYTDNDLVTLKNYYQRYRDLCVIGAAALYTLQIVDAAVDAHLATFDVSDDLSLNIRPAIYQSNNGITGVIGIRLYYR